MNWIDSVTVILFFVAILWIGLKASRYVVSKNDYLLAGRKARKWPLALSMAATDLGGATIIGTIVLAYSVGFSASWWDLCAVPPLVALAYWMPKVFSGQNVTTVPELFGKRFDQRSHTVAAVLQLLGATLVITAQNIVTSIMIQTLTGIPYDYALIISTAVFVIYTTAGGLISVIWTDIFAFAVMTMGTVISAVYLINELGGLSQIIENVPASYMSFGELDGMTLGAWILMNFFLYTTSQPYIQRVFAARDKGAARFSYLFTAGAYLVFAFLLALLGVIAFVLNPELINIEFGSVAVIHDSLPVGIRSLLLIAFLSASMSTGSSYLNGCASIFTIDIYKRMIDKSASELRCLSVAKWSTVGLAVLALLISYVTTNVIEVVVFATTVYSAVTFFPLILGFSYRWISARGAFYSMLLGLMTGGVYLVVQSDWPWFFLSKLHPIILVGSMSLVVLLLISLSDSRKQRRQERA